MYLSPKQLYVEVPLFIIVLIDKTSRFEGNDNITPYLDLYTKIVISF